MRHDMTYWFISEKDTCAWCKTI